MYTEYSLSFIIINKLLNFKMYIVFTDRILLKKQINIYNVILVLIQILIKAHPDSFISIRIFVLNKINFEW